ncbi:MAG: hypothetical protein IPM64_01680 [Phycisphaerales bacterium]|nr:hypothetical protein [Phycisphaerales bacterium]
MKRPVPGSPRRRCLLLTIACTLAAIGCHSPARPLWDEPTLASGDGYRLYSYGCSLLYRYVRGESAALAPFLSLLLRTASGDIVVESLEPSDYDPDTTDPAGHRLYRRLLRELAAATKSRRRAILTRHYIDQRSTAARLGDLVYWHDTGAMFELLPPRGQIRAHAMEAPGRANWIRPIVLTEQGIVAACSERLVWYDRNLRPIRRVSLARGTHVLSLAVDGDSVFVGTGTGSVLLWSGPSAPLREIASFPNRECSDLAIHPTGAGLLAALSDDTLQTLSPDGDILATARLTSFLVGGHPITDGVRTEFIGSTINGLLVAHDLTEPGSVRSVQVVERPPGISVTTGSNAAGVIAVEHRGRIELRNAASFELVRSLAGHSRQIQCLAFSPDGSLLVSAGELDGAIRVWRVSDGELVASLYGPRTGATAVAIQSLDMVVTGDADGSVRLWSARAAAAEAARLASSP